MRTDSRHIDISLSFLSRTDYLRRVVFVLLLGVAWAAQAQIYGFDTFPKGWKAAEEVVIANMPPIRSQGAFPLCYAFSASAILEWHKCNANGNNCSTLSPKGRPSPFDLAKFVESAVPDRNDSNSYPKTIGQALTFGGDILLNVALAESVITEECAPSDWIDTSNTISKSAFDANIRKRKDFEEFYANHHQQYVKCKGCAQVVAAAAPDAVRLLSLYPLKTPESELVAALAEPTYEGFLYLALVSKQCSRPGAKMSFYLINERTYFWPDEKLKNKVKFSEAIVKLKEILDSKRPVMVNRFCPLQKPTANCGVKMPDGSEEGFGHSFVITGYRKMCSPSGECLDAVKVHNSWGQAWQSANDDGWVNAKNLLDRTFYQYATFAWIAPVPKEEVLRRIKITK